MTINSNTVINNIKTTNGKFYVGMTRDDALNKGKHITKLFSELDTDFDNILSFKEIMQQREQAEDKLKKRKNIWCALGLFEAIGAPKNLAKSEQVCSILSNIYGGNAPSPKIYLINCLVYSLLFLGIAARKYFKMNKLQKQDCEYRVQYQELSKDEKQNSKIE